MQAAWLQASLASVNRCNLWRLQMLQGSAMRSRDWDSPQMCCVAYSKHHILYYVSNNASEERKARSAHNAGKDWFFAN